MEKKPRDAYAQFENLTKRLLGVPKAELDKKVQRYDEAKKRRRKKRG